MFLFLEEGAFLTGFKVNADLSMNMLFKTSEKSGGGSLVYRAFEQLLTEIIGAPVMEKFSRSYPEDYAAMFEAFDHKKNSIRLGGNKIIVLSISESLFFTFEKKTGKDIEKTIDKSKFSSRVRVVNRKWRFSEELLTELFQVQCDEIIALVKNVLKRPEMKGTNNIIMTGKFAEFSILKDIIMQALPAMKVIISPNAEVASISGAVIYGHEQQQPYLTSRVEKFIKKFKK